MEKPLDNLNLPHGVVAVSKEFAPTELNPAAYNPSARTEAKQLERLRCSIKSLGNHILNPLHVYGGPEEDQTDARSNEVLDGHRRRACAIELGIPKVRALVYYGPYEIVKQLFVELNSSAKKLSKRQMMEAMYRGGPEFDEVAGSYNELSDLLSDLEMEMFIERGISPFCLSLSKSVVKYLGIKPEAAKYKAMLKKTVCWIAFRNQQDQAKTFMRQHSALRDKKTTFTVNKLRKAIDDDCTLIW